MIFEKLKIYRNIAISYLCKALPIDRSKVYFTSFNGQYTCNPKAISMELSNSKKKISQIWELSSKSREKLPVNVIQVKPGSIKSIWMRSRCRVVVDNYLGWSYGYCAKNGIKYRILSSLKKKRQVNFCTWHGVPLKRIACDEPGRKGKSDYFYSSADFLTCNSEYMQAIFKRLTNNQIQVVMTGWPRNDLLFENNEDKKLKLKNKLKIPINKKVVLYAPTFRDEGAYMSGIFQLESINIEKFLQILEKKFGGKWCFVFRAHDTVFQEVEKLGYNSSGVINGNLGDDMAEYLYISDVLITDYSGSLFDYATTKKPCFLFCPDLEHYSSVERGLYLDIRTLPFSISISFDELIHNIEKFEIEIYERRIDCFQKEIGSVEDGHASKRVVEMIEQYL